MGQPPRVTLIERRIPTERPQADDKAPACVTHKTEIGNHFDGHEYSSASRSSRQFASEMPAWWAVGYCIKDF